jgi:hypothetical protein
MPTTTLFISYSRQDEPVVTRLRGDLRHAGAVIWIDHEQLAPGTPNWQRAIRDGIEAAQVVVYVGSPEAADSQYVLAEVGLARSTGRRIVPFWARGDNWHKCAPLELALTQFADGRGDRYEQGLHELLAGLGLAAAAPPIAASPLPQTLPTQLPPVEAAHPAAAPALAPSRSPASSAYRDPSVSAPVHPSALGTAPTATPSHGWRMPILIACLLLLVAGSGAALYAATHAGTPAATVTFFAAPGGQPGDTTSAKVVAHGLSTPSSGYEYDVWLIDSSTEQVTALGSLAGTSTTYTLTYTPPAILPGQGDRMEITLEHDNDVVPVGRIVLSGNFPLKTFVHGSLTGTTTTYTLTSH